MKVKQKIIDKINNVDTRMGIAKRLKTGEQNVYNAINRNVDNGRMTKMDFLKAIEAETAIPVDKILEEVSIRAER